MKKLNRKGFTLIELLAVVVILAIVLVVTVPTILNLAGNAKSDQLINGVNAVQAFEQEQYEIALTGIGTNDTNYVAPTTTGADIKSKIKYMGLGDATGVTSATAKIENGRVCIIVSTDSTSKFGAQSNVKSTNCS